MESSRRSIKLRYQYLKQIYGLFLRNLDIVENEDVMLGTVFNPLFFEFGND